MGIRHMIRFLRVQYDDSPVPNLEIKLLCCENNNDDRSSAHML